MDHLRCVVERITYQNEQNGYSVIKCRAKGYQDLVTAVGAMPEVHVGSVLNLGGSWRVDGKYGRQFAVETFEETLPATVYGMEKYLGSGLVKGIGPKYAKLIVNMFGKIISEFRRIPFCHSQIVQQIIAAVFLLRAGNNIRILHGLECT